MKPRLLAVLLPFVPCLPGSRTLQLVQPWSTGFSWAFGFLGGAGCWTFGSFAAVFTCRSTSRLTLSALTVEAPLEPWFLLLPFSLFSWRPLSPWALCSSPCLFPSLGGGAVVEPGCLLAWRRLLLGSSPVLSASSAGALAPWPATPALHFAGRGALGPLLPSLSLRALPCPLPLLLVFPSLCAFGHIALALS